VGANRRLAFVETDVAATSSDARGSGAPEVVDRGDATRRVGPGKPASALSLLSVGNAEIKPASFFLRVNG